MVFRPLGAPILHRALHIIKRKNRDLSLAAGAPVEQFAPIIASLETIEGIEVLLDAQATRKFIERRGGITVKYASTVILDGGKTQVPGIPAPAAARSIQ
jgi:hypothetical protein